MQSDRLENISRQDMRATMSDTVRKWGRELATAIASSISSAAISLSIISLWSTAQAGEIQLVTENYPPFNTVHAATGEISGSSTEKVIEIMRRAGESYHLAAFPWSRAYNMSENDPDTCLFSTAYTPSRRDKFQWVGPIVKNNKWVIFARADDTRKPKDLEDLRPYVIGVYRKAMASEVLSLKQFKTEVANYDTDNPRKLLAGRFDFWAAGETHGMEILRNQGLEKQIVPLFHFYQAKMYLACNLQMSKERIDHFNRILREMESDGTVAAIDKKYRKK